MKRIAIVTSIAAGLMLGAFAAQAKLPPAPALSDAQKAAEAEKAKAAAAKDAADLAKAQDRAVANYHKNKGIEEPKPAPHAAKAGKKK
ncbi:MAG TPA: hypothetical protein VEG36_03920 [Burkholderiales bacterium]|nr:hypothetical protein [Burkholderiales bacterium]